MKFDAARALRTVEELGDPSFAGADWEARVADFVAQKFSEMGMQVEQREVEGSPIPQKLAPWLGWLGYGALITAGYVLLLRPNPRLPLVEACALALAQGWINALLLNRIRWGRRIAPIEKTSVLIARPAGESTSQVRVVFQAVLGGLKTDFFPSLGLNREWLVMTLHWCFWLSAVIAAAARLGNKPVATVVLVSLASGSFALIWLAILSMLSWEARLSRSADGSQHAEGQGLALLLEMARSWPRNRSRPIEPVFVAAGGQRLDYAGSREVIRLLESVWPAKPSVLFLFFAPGARAEHRLLGIRLFSGQVAARRPRQNVSSPRLPLDELIRDVAKSLWIPIKGNDPWSYLQLWPFERKFKAADVVLLKGSNSQSSGDDTVDPKDLEHAAQLVTEIALRWAKEQVETPDL